jgi:hypothetical protein
MLFYSVFYYFGVAVDIYTFNFLLHAVVIVSAAARIIER